MSNLPRRKLFPAVPFERVPTSPPGPAGVAGGLWLFPGGSRLLWAAMELVLRRRGSGSLAFSEGRVILFAFDLVATGRLPRRLARTCGRLRVRAGWGRQD